MEFDKGAHLQSITLTHIFFIFLFHFILYFLQNRFDVSEADKKHIMELLRESFRDYKAKFKAQYYRPLDTPASVIARGGPKNMPAGQFADMVTYWYSSKGKVIQLLLFYFICFLCC